MDLETLLTLTEDLRLLVERARSTSGVAVISGVKGRWVTIRGTHVFLPDDPCVPSPAPRSLSKKIKRRGSEKCGKPSPKLKKDAPPKVQKAFKKLTDAKGKIDDASWANLLATFLDKSGDYVDVQIAKSRGDEK